MSKNGAKVVPKIEFLHFWCKVGHATPHFDGNELQNNNSMFKMDFDKIWTTLDQKKAKKGPKNGTDIVNFTFSLKYSMSPPFLTRIGCKEKCKAKFYFGTLNESKLPKQCLSGAKIWIFTFFMQSGACGPSFWC